MRIDPRARSEDTALGTEVSMQSEDRDIDDGPDDALPSVETTRRFLALCDRFGSHQEAVAAVVLGRRAGVYGLPERDAWPEWNAAEMRAAVKYLQQTAAGPEASPPTAPRTVRPAPDGVGWRE